MSELRNNMQVKQPHIEYTPENNGWPTETPLSDPSSPLGRKVTVGRNGETMQREVTTSQQRAGEHHKPEGRGSDQGTQSQYLSSERAPSPFKTTGYVSDPGGDTAVPSPEGHLNEDRLPHKGGDTKTSQQERGEHHRPEGK